MVHLRAFSFTDDSANVAPLSDQQPLSFTTMSAEQQLFLHRIDPAMYLVQLRQMQSCSYQQLFQSSRRILEEPWPIISGALRETQFWVKKMPDTMKEAMKRLMHCDLLHSNILTLSPPRLTVPLPEYGQALIFDYAIEYAELVSWVHEDSAEFAYWTFHDFLRVAYVSRRFLDILNEGFGSLFGGILPKAPIEPEQPEQPSPLPSLRVREPDRMLTVAMSALDLLSKTLDHLGARFGDMEPWKTHEARCSQIRPNLVNLRNIVQARPATEQYPPENLGKPYSEKQSDPVDKSHGVSFGEFQTTSYDPNSA